MPKCPEDPGSGFKQPHEHVGRTVTIAKRISPMPMAAGQLPSMRPTDQAILRRAGKSPGPNQWTDLLGTCGVHATCPWSTTNARLP